MKIPEDGYLRPISSSGQNPCKLVIVKVPDKFRKPGESMYQLASLNPDTGGHEWPANEYVAKLFPGFYKERKEEKNQVYRKKNTQNKHSSSSDRYRQSDRRFNNRKRRFKTNFRGKKSWPDKPENQHSRPKILPADIEPWLNKDQMFQKSWEYASVLPRVELDRSLNSSGENCGMPVFSQPYIYPGNANIYQNRVSQLANNQVQQSLLGNSLPHNLHGNASLHGLQGNHTVGLLGDAPLHVLCGDRPSTSTYSGLLVDPLSMNSQFNNNYHRWEDGCDSVSQPQHMAINPQLRNDVGKSRQRYFRKEKWNSSWKQNSGRNPKHGRSFRSSRNAYSRK